MTCFVSWTRRNHRIEEKSPAIGWITGNSWDARGPREKRGAECIRHQDCCVKPLLAKPRGLPDEVSHSVNVDGRDFVSEPFAFIQARHPGPGEDCDLSASENVAQASDGWFGHHGIADPIRSADEKSLDLEGPHSRRSWE